MKNSFFKIASAALCLLLITLLGFTVGAKDYNGSRNAAVPAVQTSESTLSIAGSDCISHIGDCLNSFSEKVGFFFKAVKGVFENGFSFFNRRYNPPLADNVKPETWAAVDGLGRTLPTDTGKKDEEKFVGIFYWDWHKQVVAGMDICNTTEILKQYPEIAHDYHNPVWNNFVTGSYYWDEPLYGYYSNFDAYVIRKQAELLADAGVDVIFFDATNGDLTWMQEGKFLMEVFARAVQDGVNVPKIAWMLSFQNGFYNVSSLEQLYDNVYSENYHPELWFRWHGKPLVLSGWECLDKNDPKQAQIADYFTFRYCEPSYFVGDTKYNDKTWGWCSVYEQTVYGRIKWLNYSEQMTVSVAQNATDHELVAMNDPNVTVHGRSYSTPGYSYSYDHAGKTVTVDSSIENSLLYGIQFQQQWDNALKTDPEFIFVTGWNEWTAGRYENWQGTENAFPDEFSPEYSRDIEPSKGVLKDHYYYQLAANIRRFKGMDKVDKGNNYKEIDINNGPAQWNGIYSYEHYTNNTLPRNSEGSSPKISYQSDTMRNDIVRAKTAYDKNNIYFYVETLENLKSYNDESWLRIFIDTDTSGVSPNWEGFEYKLERVSADKYVLKKSSGGNNWNECGKVDFSAKLNVLQISVPMDMLCLSYRSHAFNFKVTDNNIKNGDIMDIYTDGDAAPGGRFTFVFN